MSSDVSLLPFPRILYPSNCTLMTPKTKTSNGGSRAAVAETNGSNPERERVFSAYRQWGYLEGDLDPLGFLRPRETPELEHDGEYAREARAIYSSTIGVEINHIYRPERRQWIFDRMESPSQGFEITEIDQQRILDDDRKPERHQEDVAIVAVAGRADDKALQGITEPEKQRRQRHRCEVRVEAKHFISKERGEHGRGQQRTVGEVDDVQHAVDQRQPERDQSIHCPGHQSVEHRRNEDGR